jgi:carboxypeptidase Taq
MGQSIDQIYEKVCQHARETAILASCEAALGWDERTMLPPEAAEYRAEQMAYLAGLIHKRRTDRHLGDWLGELAASSLAADPHGDTGANIRWLKRSYERSTKLPQALVEELSRTATLGQHVWQQARADDDFAKFVPLLQKTIELKRAQADALGYDESRYDALLDDYEPNERTSSLSKVLGDLREALVPLVAEITNSGRHPDKSILTRSFPVDRQAAFGRDVAAKIGFDFRRGRLDVTAHPFCAGLGPNDTRLTTRYDEHFFSSALFGTMHEAGHGMYDQGLIADQYGLPLGEAISLGIHESQSRLWENFVGRSKSFWMYFFPLAKRTFPEALGSVNLDAFYFAINDVRPSLIRVEADEATYNLHILVRFELEQALLGDDLPVADLPAAWREKYKNYLDIEPTNDADGALQDIHWSAGLMGYFPTYSLGNLYAAQFFETADRELGGLNRQFERGEFQPLLGWLRDRIHVQGQRYTAAELVERVTGKPLSHEPLMRHLRDKFGFYKDSKVSLA